MTDTAISPLRRRLIEDMAIRRLSPKTQLHYIRHVKRFADFLGRSADKATAEDVHRYQLWLASFGTTVPTLNAGASALRFFFRVTLKRRDLAEAVVSVREPRRLPVRAGRDRIEKDPDQRVQEALSLVFAKFAELHSVRQVHVWLRDEGIALPVACHGAAEGRSIAWRLPLYNTVHNILTNPVYAGAYAFLELTRFRGAHQAFSGGFSDAQDALALFT